MLTEEICEIRLRHFLLHEDKTKHNYMKSAILNYICAAARHIPHACTPCVCVCVRCLVKPVCSLFNDRMWEEAICAKLKCGLCKLN